MSVDNTVKSLVKALTVLECFVDGGAEMGVSDVAKAVGISKSNAFEIMHTFESMGYMEKNPVSSKYSLSVKFLQFAPVVNQHIGYYRLVYDVMDDLAEQAQNVVHFSIPHGTDVLYLYSSFPKSQRKDFPYRPVVGETCPMYCSSMGKAILAFSSPERMEAVERQKKCRFTDLTIVDNELLRRDVAEAKAKGYAFDRGEHQYGVSAVGVPIIDRKGDLLAAMSICGIADSFTDAKKAIYVRLLKEASFQITVRM